MTVLKDIPQEALMKHTMIKFVSSVQENIDGLKKQRGLSSGIVFEYESSKWTCYGMPLGFFLITISHSHFPYMKSLIWGPLI